MIFKKIIHHRILAVLGSLITIVLLFSPSVAFALAAPTPSTIQPPPVIDIPEIENPTKASNVSELISRAIKLLLAIITMASVIMIIVSGFRMVAYGGNPAELSKAKSGLVWSIIGLVIAIMSFSIISIIQRLIG